MDELAGAETVNINLGKLVFDMRKEVKIPLQSQLGMMPALHENLRAALPDCFLNFFVDLLMRDYVGVIVAFHAVKRAKLAIDIADVRVVDVSINDIGDDPVAASLVGRSFGQLTPPVGQRPQLLQRQPVKPQRLLPIDALAIPYPLQELIE